MPAEPIPQEQERARALALQVIEFHNAALAIRGLEYHGYTEEQATNEAFKATFVDPIATALAEQRERDAQAADNVCTCLGTGGQSQAGAAIRGIDA